MSSLRFPAKPTAVGNLLKLTDRFVAKNAPYGRSLAMTSGFCGKMMESQIVLAMPSCNYFATIAWYK
jgi:hypothetical protein